MGEDRDPKGRRGAMGPRDRAPVSSMAAISSSDSERVEAPLASAGAGLTEPRTRPAEPIAHGAPVPRRLADASGEGRRWRGPVIAIGLTMGAAAISALVLAGMQDNAIYSKPVDQLLAQRARFVGRPVRADGLLVHGSLVKRDQPCEYRFTISRGGLDLPVRFAQCVVPDTFRDIPDIDVGVTVEGELQPDDTFEATSVLAKCPSKYEMQEKRQHGEQMPHGALAEEAPLSPAAQARVQP